MSRFYLFGLAVCLVIILIKRLDLFLRDINSPLKGHRVNFDICHFNLFGNPITLLVTIKILLQCRLIKFDRFLEVFRIKFNKADFDSFFDKSVVLQNPLFSNIQESEQELLKFFIKEILGHGRLKILGFHTILAQDGLVPSNVKPTVYLKRRITHNRPLALALCHIYTQPFSSLCHQPLVNKTLQCPLFYIKGLYHIIIPLVLIPPLQSRYHVPVGLLIFRPTDYLSIDIGNF